MKVKIGLILVMLAAVGAPPAASQLPSPQALLVEVSGSGSGKITAPGIDCPSDCKQAYLQTPGQAWLPVQVTLTATPRTQSQFQGWGEGCATATGPTCTLELTPHASVTTTLVTAIFVLLPPPPRLTVSVDGSGMVTGDGINCPTRCSVSLHSLPAVEAAAAGWTFTGWTGSCTGTAPSCAVTTTSPGANYTVVAHFKQLPPSQLTITTRGPGKVTGPGIDCPRDCEERISVPIVLTAVLAQGQMSVSWGPPCDTAKEDPSSKSPSLNCHLANTGAPISVSATFGR